MSKVKIRKPHKKTDMWSAKTFQTKWIAGPIKARLV